MIDIPPIKETAPIAQAFLAKGHFMDRNIGMVINTVETTINVAPMKTKISGNCACSTVKPHIMHM